MYADILVDIGLSLRVKTRTLQRPEIVQSQMATLYKAALGWWQAG